MKRFSKFGLPALFCAAGLLVGAAVAQDGGGDGGGGGAMGIPAWAMKGKEHESLKKYVGTWDAAVTGMPPGTATNALILGDCFLEQKFEGGGGMFQGRMITSYDTVDKEWVAIWIDSMKPVFSISRGSEKDGVITFQTNDPSMTGASGKRIPGKMVLTWTGDTSYKLEMYEGETKTMDVVYTKK